MPSPQFHIHVDARWISEAFANLLLGELGFWRMDFARESGEGASHVPDHHLTIKISNARTFHAVFDRLESFLYANDAMAGYVEGEVLPLDEELPETQFDPDVPLPFRIVNAPVEPGTFRETEVHLTLDRDRSDPRLVECLRKMGLYVAFLPKTYGMAQVFTAQGTRKHIGIVIEQLRAYIDRAGGLVAGSIKEERIVRWWTSGPDVQLPPVISHIECLPSTEHFGIQ